jgi:rod shape-determining protein MreD
MKYLFLAVSAFLAIVAQAIAGSNFFLFNFLDLSLILIAYWVLYRSRIQALFLGTLSGILLDALLGWPLGYNGFGRTLAAFAMGQAARKFNVEETWIRFVLIAVSSCLSSVSVYFLFALLQRTSSVVFLGASFLQALFTAAVGCILLLLLDTYGPAQPRKAG